MHSWVEIYCNTKNLMIKTKSLMIPGNINFTAPRLSILLPEARSLSRLSNTQENKDSSNGVCLKMKAPTLFQQLLSTNTLKHPTDQSERENNNKKKPQ